MNMNNIRNPIQFLNGFDYSFCKKDGSFVIIFKKISILIFVSSFPFKVFVIINKIDLNSLFGYRGHLNNQRHVYVIDNQIHPREANYLMQLMSSFINITIARHKNPYLPAYIIYHFRYIIRR